MWRRVLIILAFVLVWALTVSAAMARFYTDYQTLEFRGHPLKLRDTYYNGVSLTDEYGARMVMIYHDPGNPNFIRIQVSYRDVRILYYYSRPGPGPTVTFSDGSTVPAPPWGGGIPDDLARIANSLPQGLQREEMLLLQTLLNYRTAGRWPHLDLWGRRAAAWAVVLGIGAGLLLWRTGKRRT